MTDRQRRAMGAGSVVLHQGLWRGKLPRSLVAPGAKRWLPTSFGPHEEEACHQYVDEMVALARERVDAKLLETGITFGSLWPRYVRSRVQDATRRRGARSGSKVRSRLEGMGTNWLSGASFWSLELSLVNASHIEDYLDWLRDEAEGSKGEPLSDSWLAQVAVAIRGVFPMVKMPAPHFETPKSNRKVSNALNLERQKFLFQRVISDPIDRLIAGCQMGAGLRIGEILSLKVSCIFLGSDPHLIIETGGPDGALTKSGEERRVELVEPGLGFFKRALQYAYRPNPKGLLFSGPQGGYLGQWGEKFPGWSEAMGTRIVSHSMRHAYALSILSGLWGYQPQGITFLSRQLGHKDIKTTQKAYGHWDPGSGRLTAMAMRGELAAMRPVTAADILGESESELQMQTLTKSTEVPRFGGLHLARSNQETAAFSTIGVSNGNCSKRDDLPEKAGVVARSVAYEAAIEVLSGMVRDRDITEAAVRLAEALLPSHEAAKFMVAYLSGDPLVADYARAMAAAVIEAHQEEIGVAQ